VVAGEAAYFKANSTDLWGTDGTSAGTRRLGTSVAGPLAAAGNRVVLAGNDAEHGRELWAADLEGSTVVPLVDLRPGPQSSSPEPLVSLGSRALILGFRDEGYGLWDTDGTEQGTVSLGIFRDYFDWMKAAPGSVSLLSLDDGVTGVEPWVTDGTVEGTRLLADLVPGPDSSGPFGYTASERTIYFFAFDPSGAEKLWVSDGTTEGTVEVAGADSVLEPLEGSLTVVKGTAFFADQRFSSLGLWKTTGDGMNRVAELGNAEPGVFRGVGDLLFFTVRRVAPDGALHELWRSDGTAAGTFPLASFSHPLPPAFLGEAEGVLLFSAGQEGGPFPGVHALWRTDGTATGTRKVQDITAGPLVTLGAYAYFPADDGIVGMELWSARTSLLTGKTELALDELRAELGAAGLPLGIARSLRAKLATGDRGGLQAFLRELEALPAKVLDASAAESLRTFAVEILELR
jgi:ELWxxDGT repeat protein